MAAEEEKKEEGVKLVQLSEAWVHLRESDNLIEGLCYILPAAVKTTYNFSINLWHAKCEESWGVLVSGAGRVCVVLCSV